MTILLAVALVITGLWGGYNYFLNREHAIQMDNMHQRSFFDMVSRVNNIETSLSKLMVSGDQGQHLILVSEIWRHADGAQADLASLPISHLSLVETSKLLNQMSDYSSYLTKKIGQGKTLTVDENKNLQELHNSYVALGDKLRELQDEINSGGVRWGDIRRQGSRLGEGTDDLITHQLVSIEKSSIKYPSLIYDGPFSESLKEFDNVRLEGKEIDQKEAIEVVRNFIGDEKIAEIDEWSESNGDIKCWGVSASLKDGRGPFCFTVSKRGGKVVNMVGDPGAQNVTLSVEKAREVASEFLKDKGYESMSPAYQQFDQGICTINFAYRQGDVMVYPDLIKVKISLDDGQVVGFESKNYLIAHKERDIEEPEISVEQARELVNPSFKIESERLALIPTPSRNERLCYEFNGKFGEDRFIVYIDAKTGEEVDILKIIDSNMGTLVI